MEIDAILKKAFEEMMMSKIKYYDDTSSVENKIIYEKALLRYEKVRNEGVNNVDINNNVFNAYDEFKVEDIDDYKSTKSIDCLSQNELILSEINLANLWTEIITELDLLNSKTKIDDEVCKKLKKILYVLVLIRKKIGEKHGGYEHYSDILRGRKGYSRKEIKIFRSYVKGKYEKKLKDLVNEDEIYKKNEDIVKESSIQSLGEMSLGLTLEKFLKETMDFYKDFNKDLYMIYRFMYEKSLFKLESGKYKAPAEFTTILPISKVPIIYGTYKNSAVDLETMSHEFGHAVQMYLCRDDNFKVIIPTMDVCEISSAFLEICMREYYLYMLGEEEFKNYLYIKQKEIYETIIWAAEVDEFQEWLYTTEFNSFEDFLKEDIDIRFLLQSHIFREPFYYIEYALAYDIALEEQKKDYDHMDKFIEIAKMGGRQGFVDTLRNLKIGSHILSMWGMDKK